MRTVFVAVTEFLSSQSDLIRFVSDRFDTQIDTQDLDKKSPAEAGLLCLHETPSAHLGDAVSPDY